MTQVSGAVFLSYASEDTEAAGRIAEALRAAGIEVWFDKSELRGGDAWDQSIRKQIKTCGLFIPVISHTTHDRREGYFRLEWKLAVDRSHLMDAGMTFLLPVVIDNTRNDDERVPERFREVQWTRLPGGETPAAVVEHVRRLLEPAEPHAPAPGHSPTGPMSAATRPPQGLASGSWWKRTPALAAAVVVLITVAYLAIEKPWISKPPASSTTSAIAAPAGFAPPPHSIAVLPFVNLSGDKEQEYFSDGLTEELLNSLAQINELQVAARTSAFSFKGKDTDLGTIARKLNVGAILEGSVRRSGNTVRITAQLINAVTGFHLWSKTYDRDLKDVLKLQTEIAAAVAGALKVTLLGDVAAKVELGGTRNPAAFDAYLRAAKAERSVHDTNDWDPAIAAYTEAIRLDPNYALAFVERANAFVGLAVGERTPAARREGFDKAQADVREALTLAPDLARAHGVLASVFHWGFLDFTQARSEYERALELAPGDAVVLRDSGYFANVMGHFDAGIAAVRHAVALDPLSADSYFTLGQALYTARRYDEAVAALAELFRLHPDWAVAAMEQRGFVYYGLGDLEGARASCEAKPDDDASLQCLALVYDKLGRHADAEAELAKLKARRGDAVAYGYATIYAQWGNKAKALEWLDTALRLRDYGLFFLKTDPLIDPLRQEPRFQAVMRELKFPD